MEEHMANSKTINWAILIGFLALNLVGFGLSHKRRQAEAASQRWLMEIKGRQGDALAKWHAADSIPIESSMCKGAIRKLKVVNDGLVLNESSNAIRPTLNSKQTDKLTDAIFGLAKAYRRGTSAALLNYMDAHEEKLNTISVGKFTDYLVEKHGLDRGELAQLSLEQQFSTFWEAYNVTPEWKAIVAQESNIHIWKCDADSGESISEPSQLDGVTSELWQRRGVRHHNFENANDTVAENLAMHGAVMIADVRLVVQHTGEGVHTICPYTVRFWYSEQRQDWVPHLLLQFRTSQDIPDKILF